MNLEEFYLNYCSDIQRVINDRVQSGEGPFPSSELVFAEVVMQHLADSGICEEPIVCHWNGMVGNSKLRITGYAISSDQSALDLFVTHYFGTDSLQNLSDSDAIGTASEGVRFLMRAAKGALDSRVDPTHPVRSLISTIRACWVGIDRIRVFLITDGKTKSKRFSSKEVNGKNVAIEAVDIERLFRHTEGKPRDELAINLINVIGRPLPCVHVPDPDADYEYALTAFPGALIRDLYLRFGTRLLEANVRTFLGAGRKKSVNYGVIKTLKDEPEHFLAFNNGLVIVCDDAAFERSSDGNIGLSSLKGLQIVNGGQTTSSIYFASRDDKTIDLSHVMVPAKIIILKEPQDDARERLISNVSRFANSQNAVKLSDLSSNRPFHIQLEHLANETWCPDGSSRWFYERAAGAYNVMLLRDGKTPALRRSLQDAIPPKRKLTKNDIAKYHEAWRGRPDIVAKGGEKNFIEFMDALDSDPSIVPSPLDSRWYRSMIAKVILFKAIESMIKKHEAKQIFRQGWVNIATYVVSIVALRIGDNLNLDMIWKQQDISSELRNLLWDWALIINSEFNNIAPGQQFSEVAKRSDTWAKIRSCDFSLPNSQIPELQ